MRIIAGATPRSSATALAWYREVEQEDWESPADMKQKYRNASVVAGNRVVFSIKGNDYRLVVRISVSRRLHPVHRYPSRI